MPKNNNPRMLLAQVRHGDFAHPGDTQAIDLVLEKVQKLLHHPDENLGQIQALDLGCGLGGTAAYIQQKTTWKIAGLDQDPAAIQYAQAHYPNLFFKEGKAQDLDKHFETQFDLIYLFNVFYALPEQKEALATMKKVAKKNALLVIFDYTYPNKSKPSTLTDLNDKLMQPIQPNDLEDWLKETGWELIETTDLSGKFEEWYEVFLSKLVQDKEQILNEFTQEAYDKVYDTFSAIGENIQRRELGGNVFYARGV